MKDWVSGFSCGNVHCCHVCNAIAPHADAALCIRCDSEVGARVHYDPQPNPNVPFPPQEEPECMAEDMPPRKKCDPADFGWIAEQCPDLESMGWRKVAAAAGAVVANDILDKIEVRLFETAAGEWRVHVFVEAYTDGPGDEIPPVPLNAVLDDVAMVTSYGPMVVEKLVDLLRRHADRLQSEIDAALSPQARKDDER